MATINLNINGQKQIVDADPNTPVLWVLRDHLNLVGTKFGCGMAQCGACTIHLDGSATRSCILPVSSVENKEIITIEGLSKDADHPVQKAWLEHDVAQCGYCQAGQNMGEGGIIDGIGNALFGEMTFKDGVPDKNNFHQYKMIRQKETPRSVEVHFVKNEEDPTGLGEPLFPPAFAAVANALYKATGKRFYDQPFAKEIETSPSRM